MDPLSAISLAGTVVQFVDFGFKIVKIAEEFQRSASGASVENDRIDSLTIKMQALALDLQPQKIEFSMTADERRLNDLAKECQSLSENLLDLLGTLKIQDSSKKSKRQALSATFRNMRKKNEKEELRARLERCKQQLHLQLSQTTR